MKFLGEVRFCLGTKFEYDRPNGVIYLSLRAMIERALIRFRMADCKPCSTPMAVGQILRCNNLS
jgi:hypothetical protein